MSDLIQQALADSTDTKAVICEAGAVAQVGAMFTDLFPGQRAIVVGDQRTMDVIGDKVVQVLQGAGVEVLDPYVFPGDPELYAKYENCEQVRDMLKPLDAIAVTVGAGTLNDIVKRASGELGRGYLVVATAASMDGYTAFGSSIALDGFKQTMNCPAPTGCLADLSVLAAAPQVMTASGYGDLLGKVPAGADWMIADALGIESIDQSVWELVQGPLRHALSRPHDLAVGNVSAVGDLAEGLVMSGLAMQAYQSSRPASGAEHQFSHIWEMEGHGVDDTPRRLSHGFKVGIGSVAVAALFEALLQRDLGQLDVDAAVAKWPSKDEIEANVRRSITDSRLVDEAVSLSLKKYVTPEQLAERLTLVASLWPDLTQKLAAQLIGAAELQEMLGAAGAPAHPSDIKLDWDRFRRTYVDAQMIRNRYTVLDLVYEAGIRDELVDELFSPTGFWGQQAG